jgi:K+-transporting ATPase ATPase A chain
MNGWDVPVIVIAFSVAASWPLGAYMHRVLDPPVGRPPSTAGRRLRRLLGLQDFAEQKWQAYAVSLLTFNSAMFLVVFAVLTLQHGLPLNPDGKPAMEPILAFNTAVSFVTNTNLQHYSGEAALSYLSQLSLMWLQFVSAATGLATLVAIARALHGRPTMGNFYLDLARGMCFVLLPLAIVLAIFLAISGVPMTFAGAEHVTTLEGAAQIIARGPVAGFMAIKQLGTNGGGFFGPNATHPFENPTYWTNVANSIAIIVLPMASVWMFGRIAQRMSHAAVVFAVMMVMYVGMLIAATTFEAAPTAALVSLPVEQSPNLEGKELRFGLAAAPLWAATTTASSNGSVNSMLDSYNPLAGLVAMIGLWLNVAFGGVGVGMVNMFVFIIVAVFIAGMMVGRTPEYLARKIETPEMRLALLTLLVHPVLILAGVAVFASTAWGQATVLNPGSHGLSEIIYEFSSSAANNGSGFEGLGDNTAPWNIATGLVMFFARFLPILMPLAIAASLGRKKPTSEGPGTFRTDSWMFAAVLLVTVLIIGALLFLPLAVLGPITEHLSAGG